MLRTLWRKFDRDWGWNLARLLAYTCIQTLFAVLGLQLIVLSLVLRLLAPAAEQGFIAHILRLLPDHVTIAAFATLEGSLRHAPAWILLIGLPIAGLIALTIKITYGGNILMKGMTCSMESP